MGVKNKQCGRQLPAAARPAIPKGWNLISNAAYPANKTNKKTNSLISHKANQALRLRECGSGNLAAGHEFAQFVVRHLAVDAIQADRP